MSLNAVSIKRLASPVRQDVSYDATRRNYGQANTRTFSRTKSAANHLLFFRTIKRATATPPSRPPPGCHTRSRWPTWRPAPPTRRGADVLFAQGGVDLGRVLLR